MGGRDVLKKPRPIKLGAKSSTLLPGRDSMTALGRSNRTLTDYSKQTPLDIAAADAAPVSLLTQFGTPPKRKI